MYDFILNIPTEIIFGKKAEEKVGNLMRPWARKVLMVYGSDRIFRTGLADRLIASLEAADCEVICLGGVKPNAETDWIESAIELVRKEKIEGILAVGGGSVIDSAKAVSAGAGYDGSLMDLYNNPEVQPEHCLPVGAVVTIPATASESNCMSVISDSRTGRKIAKPMPGTIPKFAVLNPELTLTVSPYQTACGGFDMFAHVFERYFDMSRKSSFLDGMAESVMRTVIETLPQVLADPQNVEKRGELMLAATVAHNDMLGPGGDFGCHEISHVITECYDVTHGAALAMIIPAWCRFMWPKEPKRFARFFKNVWGADGWSDQAVIADGIGKMEAFIQSVELKLKLSVEGNLKEHVKIVSEKSLGSRSEIGTGVFRMNQSCITEICKIFMSVVA